MVNRKLLIINTIVIFSMPLLFTIFVSACHLCDPICCYDSKEDCSPTPPGSCIGVSIDPNCWDLGGCYIAYNSPIDLYCPLYDCELHTVDNWLSTDLFYPSDGEDCIVKWGTICAGAYTGKWDWSEAKCVSCSDSIEQEHYYCEGIYGYNEAGDSECESACGADPQCDEESPGATLSDSCWGDKLEVNRKCDNNCKYSSTTYTCDSSHCGEEHDCGGQTYYCVLINGEWQWSTTWPNNFCCIDDDCAAEDNKVGKCCSPDGTGCPDGPYDYRCKYPACEFNKDCVAGYCCTVDPNLPDECKVSPGECVPQGNIRCNNKYLCDPPEWAGIESNKNLHSSNLLSLILDFFSNLFS